MNLNEIKEYIQQRRLEIMSSVPYDEDLMRKEHLKRQYIRLHHMERKVQDYKKLKEVTRMKRQLMKMLSKSY